MSEFDEAIATLRQAVARLETVPPPEPPQALVPDPRVEEIAAALAGRVDAVLARLDRILAEEG